MAPFYTAPRARLVEGPAVSREELDPRTAFVLHTREALYLWVGAHAHPDYEVQCSYARTRTARITHAHRAHRASLAAVAEAGRSRA